MTRPAARLARRVVPLLLLAAAAALAPAADRPDLDRRLLPPGLAAPLGTDSLGRDLLGRVLAGGWPTIEATAVALAAAIALGLPLGLAGARAEGAGAWARGLAALLSALPGLLLGIVAAGLLGGLSPAGAGLALAPPAAAQVALVTASCAAAQLAEPHARAAVALGVPLPRLLWRHVLPMLSGPLQGWAAARLPRLALAYGGLAFLGLGADLGRPDWGAMVWEYRTHAWTAPWLLVGPALGLLALALALRALLAPSPAAS
ncbi:ABC transporter permease subunit [Roseomonas sp. OT10]|uniref:ABC transporter permease subunit n=1 Tax=Roseomonas cutis TaxID=2897332 RepID=UPI001E4A3EC6|nr:ABC transporter permease subunit [Roseomonas sp. OT10]UFN47482.1 ABC transporter permease subunit [Roseomonas sp. OT10]